MRRKAVITGLAIALLLGIGALCAPAIVQRMAESEVDGALNRLRIQNTAVIDRGEVTIDIWRRAVSVRDIAVAPPGQASKVTVGRLTFVNPRANDDRLLAGSIVAEDLAITTAGSVTTVPRIEITNYSGPERGLSTTPGVGATARSQAVMIAKVSFDRAMVPLIVTKSETARVRRTVRNVQVKRTTDGVIGAVTVAYLAIEAPYLSPEEAPAAESAAIAMGPIDYRDFSLPALWRFYAGDGKGDREPLVRSIEVSDVSADLSLRPSGVFKGAIRSVRLDEVKTRSLGYAVTQLDLTALRARIDRPWSPSEIREQLGLALDAGRAIGFGEIEVRGAEAKLGSDDAPGWSAKLESAKLGPYADWRLESARLEGLTFERDGVRLSLASTEAEALDGQALAAYGDRVARDEVLLSTTPTVPELTRFAPRIRRVDLKGLDATTGGGSLKVEAAHVKVDAPLDDVPQRLSASLVGLDAAPAQGSTLGEALRTAEIDGLRGSASFKLILVPSTQTLSLESLDYRFEQLGTVTAQGEITEVDPRIAFTSGAERIDKALALKLAPFKIFLKDDGAVEALLRRAALKAGVPAEVYREQFAQEAEETIARVFGPPAIRSAASAAEFIRDPRSLEVTITPRDADQSLVDVIRSLELGPVGLAQTIEVAILYRR